jgi:DNA replication and repair protein RecF
MLLTRLQVTHLRNLTNLELEPAAGFNLIIGDNGSGKSSLLEAIHLLGAGRSFRHTSSKANLTGLIQHGTEQALCVGRFLTTSDDVDDMSNLHPFSIGVALHRRTGITAKAAGERVAAASHLARTLPLMVINSWTFQLIEGPSQLRRQYLDWGLFHVKQDYLATLQGWRRCLRQRNQLLRTRHGKIAGELTLWSRELARHAEAVDAARRDYTAALTPWVTSLSERLGAVPDLELTYQPGWDNAIPLLEQMERDLESDRARGFTTHGPHRADLRLKWNGIAVAERLSRGQIKSVVLTLKLAQERMVRSSGSKRPVFLIDDLAAELDSSHRQLVCELLAEERPQAFLTALERDSIDLSWFGQAGSRLFHVEQGRLRECSVIDRER